MTTKSVSPYPFLQKDTVDKFPAPLLYIGWEDHLMFCAPFCAPMPPTLKFGDMLAGALPGFYGAHPDFAKIDWDAVQWFKSGQPWTPDPAKSLQDNGLKHKDVIRFRTPGLTGIAGTCS